MGGIFAAPDEGRAIGTLVVSRAVSNPDGALLPACEAFGWIIRRVRGEMA